MPNRPVRLPVEPCASVSAAAVKGLAARDRPAKSGPGYEDDGLQAAGHASPNGSFRDGFSAASSLGLMSSAAVFSTLVRLFAAPSDWR